ncbi:MAG TPA: hypothetical protein VKK79_06795, partial [Candidatus Lokiarchaeia archaeon]|nr:hypothetical protein [Candidatus Lokiarchaeia archaeon]
RVCGCDSLLGYQLLAYTPHWIHNWFDYCINLNTILFFSFFPFPFFPLTYILKGLAKQERYKN